MTSTDLRYDDLAALFFNCTLKPSPELSHTQGLIDHSTAIMVAQGVRTEVIRAVDHDIATGVWPDMTEHGAATDAWPQVYPKVLAARQQVLASPLAPAVAALIMIAAFTKSAQVPFNFWLPGAMVAITPVSAYLHAATMVKAGIYLLLRFSTLFAGQPGWSLTLIAVGLITAVLGAAQALREHDLKALLAYSTVSQLGLLVAAIGVGTTVALAAAILYTFAHALFKATLFMLVASSTARRAAVTSGNCPV